MRLAGFFIVDRGDWCCELPTVPTFSAASCLLRCCNGTAVAAAVVVIVFVPYFGKAHLHDHSGEYATKNLTPVLTVYSTVRCCIRVVYIESWYVSTYGRILSLLVNIFTLHLRHHPLR